MGSGRLKRKKTKVWERNMLSRRRKRRWRSSSTSTSIKYFNVKIIVCTVR